MQNSKFDFLQRIDENFITLYVEDNDIVRQQTAKMLSKMLPNVLCCTNGEEGLNKYLECNVEDKSTKINLIITDIEMPKQNGLEMIKEIRKTDISIPIIIFSAYDNTEYFMEAIKIGIDGYVLKPYPIDKISEVLEKVITKHYAIKNILKLQGDYIWDNSTKTLIQKDKTLKLTKNESKLIEFLSSNDKSIKSLESIEYYIFDDLDFNERRVRNVITRLNNKLSTNIIESVYGQGYKLILLD
ncbi:response regulator transcription factor [Poseidonibacter lekithochrous]|uniref:response regulator transcription factor n=1 Tax=Poseidonibacter lekithochrous TaxID=1904463 RepID=UPI0008FC5C84|nr:response regulator [Poseidonibacter lekithochrous]QKJ23546.1 two-component system response regulator, OmpR family [Poseidonibacter lekithochrous]